MYIRNLPHSRRSRNRRRSGRWVRCAILDRKWVAPSAAIGLYLLDDNRRETERAVDRYGEPIALAPTSSESDLIHAIRRYGEGRYRLVARDRQGRILARRDFVAAIFAHGLDAATHTPRTDVEHLKSELAAALEAAESARAQRDAARAEAEASKQAVAERDAEITGLELALERQSQALRRARRLYAELGSEGASTQHREADRPTSGDVAEPRTDRPREGSTGRGPSGAAADDGKPKLFGLGRAEFKEAVGMLKDLIRDRPSADSGSGVDPPAESAGPVGDEDAP